MTRQDLLDELTAERFGPIPRTPTQVARFEDEHPRRRVVLRRRRELIDAIGGYYDESEDE